MNIKIRKIISEILIVAFLMTSVIIPNSSVFADGQKKTTNVIKNNVQILVKYKNAAKGESVKTKISNKLKLNKLEMKKKNKRTGAELLEINSNDSINDVVKELKKDPDVEYAQVNHKLTVLSESLDERYGEQWGLENSGQTIQSVRGKAGIDINAEKAWETTMGFPSVLVGVLDTGIDKNHPDLKNNIFTNSNEIAGNGADDDGNGYIDDNNGWDFANDDSTVFDSTSSDTHGTHVAGIIAASADKAGIRGVAPNVKILPLKFISNGTGYTSDAIDAIEYAKQMGVKIINCSFGGTDDNPVLKDVMQSSGILFVCAAGNNKEKLDSNPIYPAAFSIPGKLTVAAADNKGDLSDISNYGSKVDVAAPGESILSTIPDEMYSYKSGTSMAAAFVTGVAALISSTTTDMTSAQLAVRIKNSVKKLAGLDGKVASGGIVDAAKALDNATDGVSAASSGNTTVGKVSDKGGMMVAMAAEISETLQEQIHFGEKGISVSTGNFSKSCTDMSAPAPGFIININRTYNSKDTRASSTMGRGWTFGFEGSLKHDTNNTALCTVTLPNGAAQNFIKKSDGTYTANDSHSTLVKKSDNSYVLTTKDQYTYGFNPAGWICWMKDRNGNTIDITVDTNGKVEKITDSAGRIYEVAYKNPLTKDYIKSITGPSGRTVQYTYDSSNRLWKVTDPNGKITAIYEYDSSNYLTTVKDYFEAVIEKVTYDHTSGTHKALTYRDSYNNLYTYNYDTSNRITTITDLNGRVTKKWYDTAMYVIKSQDYEYSAGTNPNVKQTIVDYYLDGNGFNKFGEEEYITDRNGNKTHYIRDNNGNIKQITNPDKSSSYYTYDEKNNLIMEKDENEKCTYYIYDSNSINLIKKVQPLNGTDAYSELSEKYKFAISSYSYYSDAEASKLGYRAKGLLKSETDPEANTTRYEYDIYGNRTKLTDPDGNVTTNGYNIIGWMTHTISPKGYRTEYFYDNNGLVVKKVQNGGETTRIVYNPMGLKTQEISPNQYNPENDNLAGQTYNDLTVGYRYTYYPTGKIETRKDPENNQTTYTYDMYGNLLSETRPNGSVLLHDYDIMNRIKRDYFKNDSGSPSVVLMDYSYDILADGRTTKTETEYLNGTDTAVTVLTYNFEGKLLEQQNPDNTKSSTAYYANGMVMSMTDGNGSTTYIKYDGLNNPTETWIPMEPGKYSYSAVTYYKNGKKKEEKLGRDKVELYSVPLADRLITKTYAYYPDGQLKTVSDSTGAKTIYSYDADGNMSMENVYKSSSIVDTIEYEYNHLDKPTVKKVHVKTGDLAGNSFDSNSTTKLATTYTYDNNGNLKTATGPDLITTTYNYDNMNRQKGTMKPGLDESGNPVTITTSTEYDWEGKVLSKTDENTHKTVYDYNKRGFLVKTTDARNGVTAIDYDTAGRRIAEVSPKNYDPDKTIDQMDRTVYSYDKMGRVKTEMEIFHEKKVNPDTYQWLPDNLTQVIVKAYKYDANGNVVKELDGEGYKSGTGTTEDERINTGYGTEYGYTLSNKLALALDPVSRERNLTYTKKIVYDGAGRKVSETDADGHATCFSYDDAGRILSVSVRKSEGSPEQVINTSTYDLAGNKLTETDGNGNTTKYEYNAFDKIRKTVYPCDASMPEYTVTCQYDVSGNLARQEDSTGTVNLFTYDNEGRQLSVTEEDKNGKNSITTYTSYDKAGNKRFETDGNGNRKENVYDELDRLTDVKVWVTALYDTKKLQTTHYGYDKNGNQTTVTDWLGNMTENVYDPINRLIEKIDANLKSIQKLEYNACSIQTKSYGAYDASTICCTQFFYDRNKRLTCTIDPEGNASRQDYDNTDKVATKTDGRGNVTRYEYDQFDRIIMITDALGWETSYSYDLCGNMLTQTNGNGNTALFEYNVRNKLLKKIDAGGRNGSADKYTYNNEKVESYTYTPDGNMATKLDRNGRTAVFTYDAHGRMLSKAIDNEKISYTYDNNNNQLTMTDGTGTTRRAYDELGRVITKYIPGIGSNTYIYDEISGLTTGFHAERFVDVKGNHKLTIYDQMGRIKEVSDGVNDSTVYEYYDNGARKSIKYGYDEESGVYSGKEEYVYYKNNLIHTLINRKSDGSVLDSYHYEYDAANNQTIKTDGKGDTLFAYDALNRLKKITEPGGARITEYTFDGAGNRFTEMVTEASKTTTTTYTYNEQSRLTKSFKTDTAGVKETTVYSYDSNGNMTGKRSETTRAIDPANPPTVKAWMFFDGEGSNNPNIPSSILYGTASYEYDVWNQMVKALTVDGNEINKYNGEGLRVEKTVGSQTTRYVYEYDKVVLELDDKGRQTARNVYGVNLLSRKVGNTGNYYYMYNGHGDVTALIDIATGTIGAQYYYDAFGNPVAEGTVEGGINNPIRYAGYQYDKETGLYYCNARMYDSKIARFLQEDTYRGDPNDPLSLNLYTYCHNEPIMYKDPTGHVPALVNVGGVKVGNADVTNGVTTGNLTDIVKGLGGSTTWNGKTGVATVKIKDVETGKWETTTYNTKTMKDSNGNSFTIENGKIQVGVRQTANQAGVGDTISWWSDCKKETNILVQPDMKYAPVQVTRAGNDVTIKAYVAFTGDSNEIMPSTSISYITTPGGKTPPHGTTYGEIAAQSIMDTWKGTYTVYGQKVNVSTEIYSNSYSPNKILQPVVSSDKQKYLNYEILVGSEHIAQKFGMRSHEDLSLSGKIRGVAEAIIPGDYNGESILNWSIAKSSPNTVIYTHANDEYIGDNWFKQTAAHEFGHALGLGDAYNAGYRGGSWAGSMDGYYAPYKYYVTDDYSNSYDVYVPDNDIMIEGASQNYVYDNDIRMVLDAYRTGKVQLYPWGSKEFIKR